MRATFPTRGLILSATVLLAATSCSRPPPSSSGQSKPEFPASFDQVRLPRTSPQTSPQPPSSSDQTPSPPTSPATQTVDPVDYFWAGFFAQSFSEVNYATHNATLADWQKFLAQGRTSFVKANATPDVLASFDQAGATFSSLPLQTPLEQWTPEQVQAAASVQIDPTALKAWLGPVNTPGPFFYWLGYHVSFLAATAPSEINDWGESMDQIQPSFGSLLKDFPSFRDNFPTAMASLGPDAHQALLSLATQSEQISAANQGVSVPELEAMEHQAKIILNAAANGNLTR